MKCQTSAKGEKVRLATSNYNGIPVIILWATLLKFQTYSYILKFYNWNNSYKIYIPDETGFTYKRKV